MNNTLQNNNKDTRDTKTSGRPKAIKALVISLELLALGVLMYLIALPAIPAIQYKMSEKENIKVDFKDIDEIKKITAQIAGLPNANDAVFSDAMDNGQDNSELDQDNFISTSTTTSDIIDDNQETSIANTEEVKKVAPPAPAKINIPNTLIIPKIGVKIPIIESDDENYGLDRGAWKLPKSATPEEIGNMIITGHRFKYLPPSNLTFYLFHKLEEGDIASVIWNNNTYYYKIHETKIVPAEDISILKQTKNSTLTMYTCDPIYSTKNRLVVIAELIE